jgi:hypothetical protein
MVSSDPSLVEELHPFAQQLQALKKQREEALAPLINDLKALLQEQLHHYSAQFTGEWDHLSAQLQTVDTEQCRLLESQLQELLAHYSYEPMSKLLFMVSNAGLDYLSLDPMQVDFLKQHRRITRRIQKSLQKVSQATSLQQLTARVEAAAALMHWQQLPHPQKLIHYQQQLFTAVVDRLSDFLFSPTAHLPQQEIHPHNRSVIAQIFNTAWIHDPAVCEYYLCEFDQLAAEEKRKAGS